MVIYMKKNSNKYRGNSNQIYSLNYKFDSTSIAGKFSGTALDLIKKYNELAKDAQSNSDYVSAEVFRQYAEHYRKIVTDINEKRNQQQSTKNAPAQETEEQPSEISSAMNMIDTVIENDSDANVDLFENANEEVENPADVIDFGSNVVEFVPEEKTQATTVSEKKEFTVIEISSENSKAEIIDNATEEGAKPRRKYVRKKAV